MLRKTLITIALCAPMAGAAFDFSGYAKPKEIASENQEQRERLESIYRPMGVPPDELRRMSPSMAGAVDTLADRGKEEFLRVRQNTMRQMGMEPDHNLFVFLSHSMPEPLLKAYIREAMWYGGQIVMRGFPEGHDLQSWIREYATQYIENKSVMAEIQINPVPYDLYGIDRVPAMVWDENVAFDDCAESYKAMAKDDRGDLREIDRCKPKDPETFFKIKGSVTVDYALEQFSDNGANHAQERLAVGRGFIGGGDVHQQEFVGDWDAEPSPAQYQMLSEIADKLKKSYAAHSQKMAEIFK